MLWGHFCAHYYCKSKSFICWCFNIFLFLKCIPAGANRLKRFAEVCCISCIDYVFNSSVAAGFSWHCCCKKIYCRILQTLGFTVKPVICQLAISNIIMVFTYRTHQADVMVKKQKQAFPHVGFVYCTCSRIRLPRITLYQHVSVMKFYNEVFTSPEIPLRRRKPWYVLLQKTQFSHNEFIHKTPDFQKLWVFIKSSPFVA